MSSPSVSIATSPATPADVGVLLAMAKREAEYERLTKDFTATEQTLRAGLFADPPAAEAIIAWAEGKPADKQPVGFAIFFTTFSTFGARRGIYLEDLFVEEAWRGHGVGRQLIAHVAAIAHERRCHALQWSVLKWNDSAIRFYRSLGAQPLDAWHHFSLAGASLNDLAQQHAPHAPERK